MMFPRHRMSTFLSGGCLTTKRFFLLDKPAGEAKSSSPWEACPAGTHVLQVSKPSCHCARVTEDGYVVTGFPRARE